MSMFDMVILAGGTPTADSPLYPYTHGRPKAMIDINGRPMIEWIIEAGQQSQNIADVIVVGLDDQGVQRSLNTLRPVHFLPNQGGMVSNGMFALDWLAQHRPQTKVIVGCSSDIPHTKAHMIDDLIALCQPLDCVMYGIYSFPDQITARYPTAKRTYSKFQGGVQIATGDMFVLQTAFRDTNESLWQAITEARKKPWKVAQAVGFSTLFKYLTRRLSIQEAAEIAGRVLANDPQAIKVLPTPHVELTMDGDKPHQIDILRQTFR